MFFVYLDINYGRQIIENIYYINNLINITLIKVYNI